MQEFNEIEALWAKHTVEVKISADEMLKQAKKEVSSLRIKSLTNIVGMALSFIAVSAIWLFFNFQSWTTYLGISIVIVAIGVYTVMLYINYRIIAKSDFTVNPNQFINQLKTYQLHKMALYNRLYWFYAIALSFGMGLYFIEVLADFEIWLKMIALTLSFGWIILCSTFFRKAIIKKETKKISLLIEKFERIGKQFNINE
jgi:hypothetical protein